MAWQVHYRSGDQNHQATITALHDAITLACQLLRDGHIVEKVVADGGMVIPVHAVAPLCDNF